MGLRVLLQSYQYPNLLEAADRVGGQLRGDKEYPFSGATKSGRVWRKVPESGARSVISTLLLCRLPSVCGDVYVKAVMLYFQPATKVNESLFYSVEIVFCLF